ncbi:MAG: hypothetical protein EOM29_09540 [Bacteroidia bacterium]|nr:hypothetical protein [Bacteroidia bacterium]
MSKKRTKKQKLKEKADKLFSELIRRSNSDWKDEATCYTCDKTAPWKELQCGHFISRSSNKLRFDERNARVQCFACNCLKSGNYIEYTLRLIEEKGKAFVDRLKKEGKEECRLSEKDLEDICNKLQSKINKL